MLAAVAVGSLVLWFAPFDCMWLPFLRLLLLHENNRVP
jgi:hypothetical protein